jgi:hypothetical protein
MKKVIHISIVGGFVAIIVSWSSVNGVGETLSMLEKKTDSSESYRRRPLVRIPMIPDMFCSCEGDELFTSCE